MTYPDPDAETVYDELGVPRVINAAGTKTRIGGSRIRPAAVEAMGRAAEAFVRLSDLQARAGELIVEATGAEAGYVTSGASAALTLAAAACIAGDDPAAMARLPDAAGRPSEVVVPRTHRTGYLHALAVAGADLVDVGTNDRRIGAGAADVEPWELRAAIGAETAAVAYVQKADLGPPLEVVVDVAHDAGVPVVVDAAAELPPRENLSRFVEAGADLVAFSGGKAVRGPQTTGILAGRADLVRSVARQHLDAHAAAPVWDPPRALVGDSRDVPRQGLGRGMKVGKEELVGLVRALELFLEEDHGARRREWRARAERVNEGLALDGLDPAIRDDASAVAPEVDVRVTDAADVSAVELVLALRREDPRVFVAADDVADGAFAVNPICLTDAEADYVVERVRAAL